MSRFTNDVLRERAILAIEDPAGEADALVPMTRKQAFDILFRDPPLYGQQRRPIADPFGSWRRSLERSGYELEDADLYAPFDVPGSE